MHKFHVSALLGPVTSDRALLPGGWIRCVLENQCSWLLLLLDEYENGIQAGSCNKLANF